MWVWVCKMERAADGYCCRFREECKRAGKKLIVWTLNRPEEMIEVGALGSNVVSALIILAGCPMGR